MTDALKTFSTRATPQSQPAGRATHKNAAGGHVFLIDDIARVRRFLVLGSSGGTYYTNAPELTRDNAEVVIRLAQTNPTALVDTITEISTQGRAPKANPAIFALAIAASEADDAGRAYALSKVNAVCRTGTHLYLFATYVQQFRRWGRGLRRAIGNWYLSKPLDREAYQLLKYRQREGWMHRDLLRKAHPMPDTDARRALHDYLMIKVMADAQPSEHALAKYGDKARSPYAGRSIDLAGLPALVDAYEQVQTANAVRATELIATHDLSWEMLPDRLVADALVWEALIAKGLPQTALLRQLPRLTKLGLTVGKTGALIAAQLADPVKLKQGRVHPINVLIAARTYAAGRSARGDSTWEPTPKIIDALDAAFYNAYGAVEPAGVRRLLALDVSGSMGSPAGGLPISCREATAALALVTLNVERDAEIIGFSDGQSHNRFGGWDQSVACRLDISARRRLDDVCTYMAGLNFGRTDCALPMLWAQKYQLDFDSIEIYTDNETWFGQIHPWQALAAYRQHVGHDVRLSVVAMTATGHTITDPDDPLQMDVAGFDTSVPQVLSDFAGGRI